MSFDEELRRALTDRASSVDSAPDGRDLARRIHKAQRKSRRAQQALLVAALVVIAGSSGAVLGAFAARPGGGTTTQSASNETVDTNVSPSTTPSTLPPAPATSTTSTPASSTTVPAEGTAGGATGATGALGNTGSAAVVRTPAGGGVHQATLDGLQVNWLTTQLSVPITVVSPGTSAACLPARVVTVSVGGDSPVAGGSGVVGLPALAPSGIAVVASGAFGSVGHPGGWWAIVETGSAAKSVAVQFPSHATVREPVTDGVAALAVLAPAGSSIGIYSGYASAVADGSAGVTSSLEFIVGGAPATVNAVNGPAQTSSGTSSGAGGGVHSRTMPGCLPASALVTGGKSSGRSHVEGGSNGQGPTAGPPAPVTAAGEVVAAFEQAYNIDPLLGLDWSFAAVDLSASSGCSLSSLGDVGTTGGYKLLPPTVGVDAVAFVSPERAVVIYQRGSGMRETGIAVLSGGSWKVSGATYCADIASSSSTTTP
jgi:hypothetical protein